MKDMLLNVGAGGGAAAAAPAAGGAGGAGAAGGAAPEAEKEEEKEEGRSSLLDVFHLLTRNAEKEESDEDMGFGLFD